MATISNVVCQGTISPAAAYTPAGTIIPYQIPSNFATALQMANGNGAPVTGTTPLIDLAAWGQVSLASTSQLVDFSALVDPGGITQNWTGGRVRIFVVQVVTATAGFDIEVYSDATNGVTFLPPVASFLPVRANGGLLLILDQNTNGANGNLITSSHKRLDFNSGSNTVVFNWMALGSSVA
jgi:hypothetical protein